LELQAENSELRRQIEALREQENVLSAQVEQQQRDILMYHFLPEHGSAAGMFGDINM